MKLIKNVIKNNEGFTLVEALVTIVIVAIVVAPITTAFMGSITQLTENEDALKANQMAQLYMESMKAKTYDQLLVDCFHSATVATVGTVTKRTNADTNFQNMPAKLAGYDITAHMNEGGFGSYVRPVVTVAPASSITIEYESSGAGENKGFIIKDNEASPSATHEDTNDLHYRGNIDIKYDDATDHIKITSEGTKTVNVDVSGVSFPIVINLVAKELEGSTYKPTVNVHSNTLDSTHTLKINPYYIENTTVECNIVAHTSGVPGVIDVSFLDKYFSALPKSNYIVYEIGVTVSKNGNDLTTIYSTITEE